MKFLSTLFFCLGSFSFLSMLASAVLGSIVVDLDFPMIPATCISCLGCLFSLVIWAGLIDRIGNR